MKPASLGHALAASLLGATLAWTPFANARRASPTPPEFTLLAAARANASRTSDAATLASVLSAAASAVPGATVDPPNRGSVTVHFTNGPNAARAASFLGFQDPYVISGDVHQQQWYVVIFGSVLSTGATQRISTTMPQIGAWDVRMTVDGRPAGALPNIVAGASPAYDLRQYAARVTTIEFTPHR